MSDQQYLQFQNERKLRDIAIANAERAQKVGNFFFAQHQKVLYPNATMYYEPPTYASLIESETNQRDEFQQRDILFGNLMTIMNQERATAKKISQVLALQEVEVLNPYFSDFKAKFTATFSGNVSYDTFLNFIHEYLSDKSSTIEANMDNIKQEESKNEKEYNNNPSYKSPSFIPPKVPPKEEKKTQPPEIRKRKLPEGNDYSSTPPNVRPWTQYTDPPEPVRPRTKRDRAPDEEGPGKKKTRQDVVGGRITGNGVITPTPINNSVSRYYVDMKHLNRNILSVKYSSTKNFKIKPIAISENVKSLIMDILLGRFNTKVYDLLPSDDKKIIQLFVRELRIDDLVSIDQEDMEKMYKDFSVLRGEYFAGNTSQEVKRALRKITLELMDLRRIPKHQGIQLLYELSL